LAVSRALSVHKLYYCLSWIQDGAAPLHYAVQVGALQTVKLLIKYKVDVNVADNVSSTCKADLGFVSHKPQIIL
jgi:ankyrin repeat protein